jgi:hypothetical protein
MVAKGKARARQRLPIPAIAQAESSRSMLAETVLETIRRVTIKEFKEPSDEEHTDVGSMQALRRRVAEKKEYMQLL